MNFIKKVIKKVALGATLGVACFAGFDSSAAVVTGQILDNAAMRNTIILTTNRGSAYSIEITASANALVNFYDIDVTNAPYYGTNYVNSSFVSRTTYPTNYVYSFVGSNGYTNWYTNQGVFTLNVTNAANTNALSPIFSAVVAGNTYATYSVDNLFVRGLVAVAPTGTNVSIVVNYRMAQ